MAESQSTGARSGSKLLAIVLLAACLSPAAPAATIILVRHAERSSAMSADAPLSAAGEERARQLSHLLKDANIRRIYVTEVRRTQQTAEPLAARLHLKPIVIAQKNVNELIDRLRELSEDETVLVVGHATTVPLIVQRLGGGSAPPMADTEYDRLTVLFHPRSGKGSVLILRYGKSTE